MNTFAPWKILHLELSEGIPALLASDYQGLYIVFWWHGIPLGHLEIQATQLPMPATQLTNLVLQTITPAVGDRLFEQGFKVHLPELFNKNSIPPNFDALVELQQPLAQLCECLLLPTSQSVCVVICTRDRPEQLARCLHSLQNLSQYPQEILVVDNAPSSDTTRQLVAQMPHIRYVLEPNPGLDIARNTGIRHTTSDIIAFTDDDVTVHPDWLAQLQQSFDDPKVMAVTGMVLPAELETEAQFIFEKYWSFHRGYRALTFDTHFFEQHKHWGVPVWRIGAGANMAFRRTAFELVGNFDERLDAGAAGCNGDSELWYRVLAEGWACRYEPTAVVYHYHRKDIDDLKQQIYSYLRGDAAARLIQFSKYRHWGNLRHLFFTLPKYYVKLFLRGLLKGFESRHSTLLVEVLGCLSGVNFYLHTVKPSFSKKQ